MKREAHSDPRLVAQQKFLDEGNFGLAPPLSRTMCGDAFHLAEEDPETHP